MPFQFFTQATQFLSPHIHNLLSHSKHISMDTIEALIALHQAERQVFLRMVDMGVDAKKARKIMAFWMWLESEGGIKELVKKISSHNDKVLGLVGLEAEVALASIQADAATPNASTIRVPVTLNLANGLDSFSLKNVLQDREKVSHGVSHIFDGVCGMIFEDILEERSKGNAKEGNGGVAIAEIVQQWVKPIEVNSNGEGEDGDKSEVLSPFGSKLNPFAKEWQPASEEKRCLYLTFSNGFPLSELEILSFFTKRYGPCVERIYVHQPRDGPPLFGKIVFKASSVPALILNGRDDIKFRIDGRTMFCKKFKPKQNDSSNP